MKLTKILKDYKLTQFTAEQIETLEKNICTFYTKMR